VSIKGFVHSLELRQFQMGKVKTLTLHSKRPKCEESGCKIIKLESHIKSRENPKREDPPESKNKKGRDIRSGEPNDNKGRSEYFRAMRSKR